MIKHSKTRLAALAMAAALLGSLFLSSCGQQETQTTQEETQTAQGVNINYGISNPWDSLMPYYSVSGSNYSRIIYDKIYDRLAYVQPDGTCLPRAASSWESAEDGYAILFHLDEKAAFHDGTPVTAQHWVDTIALVTNPECQILGRGTFACLTGTDEEGAAVAGETLGVQAVDDYTLKLTFKNPVVPEEFLVDKNREIYVLPTHLLQDIAPADLVNDDFWLNPVGSGPCKFVSEISGSSLVLESNPDYQLGAPGFDTLTITVMDKSNLLTALIAGDLDYYTFGGSISEEDRPVAEEAGFTVQEGTVPSTFYELMLNNETLSSAALRQAVAAALDKELLCQQSTGSLGTITDSSILPGTDYAGPAAQSSYDPDKAKQLLAEAGYDGQTYTLACTSQRASLAALVQQNLEAVGLKVEIETVDSATMFAGMNDGTYDMGLASHTPTSLPLWFTGARFTPQNNIFRVADLSNYTTLLNAINQETNQTARVALVDEFEAYLKEEMPFVPLWFGNALHVQSKTVTGIDYPAAACCNENVWQWQKTA
ncbi:MAG: ABC transporter substrate-binding protein [Clostridiales bacterium]|nr:ABC transporter substrate-binding protein [Clostridiales bacterium]